MLEISKEGYILYYNKPDCLNNLKVEIQNISTPKEYGQKLLNKRRKKR